MNRLLPTLALSVLIFACAASAQTTAPRSAQLNLKKGQVLNYHFEFAQLPSNDDPFARSNAKTSDNIVTVEDITSDGRISLLITTPPDANSGVRVYTLSRGGGPTTMSSGESKTDIPKFRMFLDRNGNYLGSEAIVVSEEVKTQRAKLASGELVGRSLPDSSRIKLRLKEVFGELPARSLIYQGHDWFDTIYQEGHGWHFNTAPQAAASTSNTYSETKNVRTAYHHYHASMDTLNGISVFKLTDEERYVHVLTQGQSIDLIRRTSYLRASDGVLLLQDSPSTHTSEFSGYAKEASFRQRLVLRE